MSWWGRGGGGGGVRTGAACRAPQKGRKGNNLGAPQLSAKIPHALRSPPPWASVGFFPFSFTLRAAC